MGVWSTNVEMHGVLGGMVGVPQTHVKRILFPRWHGQLIMKFILCPGFMEGFWQNIFRDIMCARSHRMSLETHVEIHFISSLAWDDFGHHMLRYISFSRLH